MYIITGGGTGIGRALAHALAAREQRVVIVGRREDALLETAAFSPLISSYQASVSTQKGREHVADFLKNEDTIHGLIHNAGTLDPIGLLSDIDATAWQNMMATNVDAPMFLTQLLLDKLSQSKVLNVSSGAAHIAFKGWGAYCVSKAALSMLTRCWQVEGTSTVFTSVMPGIVDTHMQEVARFSDCLGPEQVAFYRRLKEDNILVSPATVALFLTWLLLDVDAESYTAQEWDIYDTSHHSHWLKPPHHVPHWER